MAEPRKPSSKRGVRTRAVHGVRPEQPGPSSTPLIHSATFSFPSLEAMQAERDKHADGAYYQRDGHPTLRAAEERLAVLEGCETGLLFSSGVAAIAAVFLASLRSGDHIVSLHQSYGGTHDLLRWGRERFGWSVDLVDARDPSSWAAAFRPETRVLHLETPTNPMLCVVDLRRAADLAHAHDALLTVDNTFASPVGQRPMELGADLVAYSATKSIGGHGDLLAGAVLGPAARLEGVWKVRKVFGAVPDPAVAWQIERSLKTLPLRVEASNANALELARRLEKHPGALRVVYPGLPGHEGHELAARQMTLGFGPVVSVEVQGGGEGAMAVANALRLFRHAPSLGGVESLASLPAHTSHVQLGPEGRARAGIPEGLVRLSVGVEDVEDLWNDVDQALARVAVSAAAGRRGS